MLYYVAYFLRGNSGKCFEKKKVGEHGWAQRILVVSVCELGVRPMGIGLNGLMFLF